MIGGESTMETLCVISNGLLIVASAIFTMQRDDSPTPVVPMRQGSECLVLHSAGYLVPLERNTTSP